MKCKICDNQKHIKKSICGGCSTKIRRYRLKLAAIKYLGGKCKHCDCSYDFAEAYDFHHVDPKQKETEIGRISCKSWDYVKKELDKCILLCVLCHRKLHSKKPHEFYEMALNYNGSLDLEKLENNIPKKQIFKLKCETCDKNFKSPNKNKFNCSEYCKRKHLIKIKWPKDPNIVLKQVQESSYMAVSKIYNCSDNGVRKYLRRHKLVD